MLVQRRHPVLLLFLLILLNTALFSAVDANTLVSIPTDVSGPPLGFVTVPINIDPADGAIAIDMTLLYDADVMIAVGVNQTPISQDATLVFNVQTPGIALVALFSTVAMSGTGPIAEIEFQLVGELGESSVLDLTRAEINEGAIPTTLVDGFCTICDDSDGDVDGVTICEGDCNDDDATVYPGAVEFCNGVDDDCNDLIDDDELGEDTDGDGQHNVCDNCTDLYNPTQTDFDDDFEGDRCDLDDGLIYVTFEEPGRLLWQEESGFLAWNAYSGDLSVLKAAGVYTQIPRSNNLAGRECGLMNAYWDNGVSPGNDQLAFFLATGASVAGESDLGTNSSGEQRPNANPCP